MLQLFFGSIYSFIFVYNYYLLYGRNKQNLSHLTASHFRSIGDDTDILAEEWNKMDENGDGVITPEEFDEDLK